MGNTHQHTSTHIYAVIYAVISRARGHAWTGYRAEGSLIGCTTGKETPMFDVRRRGSHAVRRSYGLAAYLVINRKIAKEFDLSRRACSRAPTR